jgi:very-short-patch-repair endonuclease
MDVVRVLTELGGVARYGTLVELTSRRAVDRAIRESAIIRAGRGVLTLPVVDESRTAAERVDGVVSHLSAALAHGWKVKKPPARPMVTVRRNRHPRDRKGIDVKYANWEPEDVCGRTTSPVRTVIDCARALPFDAALAVADSALRSGMVKRQQLEQAVDRCPRTGREKALRVIREASPRAANPFESVLRAIARDVSGLVVVPQGAVGTIGHADLTDTRLRIAIEADSYDWHAIPEQFRYDVRRYTDMVRLRWIVLRFVWDDVMHKQDYVRGVLTDVVAWRTEVEALRRLAA